MAFDRPIEADRVDDLGLLSSFVRAPLLGPVMWILGRKLLSDGESDKVENDALQLIDECPVDTCPGPKDITNTFTLRNSNERYPDLAGTSISDIVNDSSIDEIDFNETVVYTQGQLIIKKNDENKLNMKRINKRSRKTSWSDESGQSLVEYCDLSQSSSHNNNNNNTPPSQSFLARKPIKSAMKKSSGTYVINQDEKVPLHPSKCIPSGLGGGSIKMPSGGGYQQPQHIQHGNSNGANGHISPQYGWYISMTPPTPPHFHNSSLKSDNDVSNNRETQEQQSSQSYTQYQTLHPQNFFHNTNGNAIPPQNSQQFSPLQQNQQNNMDHMPMNNIIDQYPRTELAMETCTYKHNELNNIATRPVFTRNLKGVPNNTSGWPTVPL